MMKKIKILTPIVLVGLVFVAVTVHALTIELNKNRIRAAESTMPFTLTGEKTTKLGSEFVLTVTGGSENDNEIIIPKNFEYQGFDTTKNSKVQLIESDGMQKLKLSRNSDGPMLAEEKGATKPESTQLIFLATIEGEVEFVSQTIDGKATASKLDVAIQKNSEAEDDVSEEQEKSSGESEKNKEWHNKNSEQQEVDALKSKNLSETRGNSTVSNWEEFIAALSDSSIDEISITQDLTRGKGAVPGTLSRNLIINGNNHKVDFGDNGGSLTLGSVSEETNLTLKDLTVTKLGNTAIINATNANSSNWTVNVNQLTGDASISGLVNLVNGSVVIEEGELNYNLSSNNIVFVSKNMSITNSAVVNSSVNETFYYSAANESKFSIDNGSKTKIHSENATAISLDAKSIFSAKGKDTVLKITGNSDDTGDDGALINFVGDGTEINIDDFAEVNVVSTRTVAMLMNSDGGVFNVKNSGKLNLQSDNNANDLGATLRFRASGNMTFNVESNAEINIKKTGGNAAAVRMYGENNKFDVSSGGKVNIFNSGNGTPQNGGGNGKNQGIDYAGKGSEFVLRGENSQVKIEALNGAAIDMRKYTGSIDAGEGTVFIASGKTASGTAGIFNTGVSTINMIKPLFFDFRNDKDGGAEVMNVSNGSTFTSTQSDLSTWLKGSNLDGDPDRNWYLFDYALSGANFSKIDSTNIPDEFNTGEDSYGSAGAASYSRMSGNNATAIIDELRQPTNADKFIFGHVTVPVGSEGGRDAWTNEGHVVVKVTKPNNETSEFTGHTIGMNNGSPGLVIYGEEARAGMFKIAIPDDHFVETGDKVEVIRGWRGDSNPDSDRTHESTPEQLIAPEQIARDATPPEPAEIISQIGINSEVIKGINGEVDATVSYTVNDQPAMKNGKELSTIVGKDGTWEIDAPDTALVNGDTLQFFLTDKAGNKNPVEDMEFHDAAFKKGTIKVVMDAFSKPIVYGDEAESNLEDEIVEFRIELKVPFRDTSTGFPEVFSLQNSFPSTALKLNGNEPFKVVNENGVDVTKKFATSMNDDKLVTSLSSPGLGGSEIYGHVLNIQYNLIAKKGVDLMPYLKNGFYRFNLDAAFQYSKTEELLQSNVAEGTLPGPMGSATAYYRDEDGNEIQGFPPITQEGKVAMDEFEFKQLEIDNYEFVNSEGPLSGLFEVDPLETIFTYKANKLDLTQTVERLNGEKGTEATIGEVLQYGLELKTPFSGETPEVFYKTFTFTEMLDPQLEVPTDTILKKNDGSSVGRVEYEASTHTLVATISEEDKVSRSEDLQLEYKAKVKNNTNIGTEIKAKATVEGSYTNGSSAKSQDSNEVTTLITDGVLTFISAPNKLSFGDDLKLAPTNKLYPLKNFDSALAVKDNRVSGNWSMVARVIKPMTGKSGRVLNGGLRYYKGSVDNEMTEDSLSVYDAQSQENEVLISDSWQEKIEGPMLKVRSGQATEETYSGTIEWELQDVPGNDGFLDDL